MPDSEKLKIYVLSLVRKDLERIKDHESIDTIKQLITRVDLSNISTVVDTSKITQECKHLYTFLVMIQKNLISISLELGVYSFKLFLKDISYMSKQDSFGIKDSTTDF